MRGWLTVLLAALTAAIVSPQAFALAPSAADADYLIITADKYADEVAPLAEWKHNKGYKTYVAKLAEVGSTEADIKTYIQNAYSNGVPTTYVVLVGDHEDLPASQVIGHQAYTNGYVWYTDHPYSLVDGGDEYPDLYIARLPGDTEQQITTMVNKILTYEKTPDTGNWYDDVLTAGQFEKSDTNALVSGRAFMEDLHQIADFLGPDYDFYGPWNGFTNDAFNKGFTIHTAFKWDTSPTNALQYCDYGYPGKRTPPTDVPAVWRAMGAGATNYNDATIEVSAAINNGVCMVFHRDHGNAGGSGWTAPRFEDVNVYALSNGNKLPVVFSLNCDTGWFDDRDKFAEAWMRHPNGGALCLVAAVRTSWSGYNDLYHMGIMDTMWDDYSTYDDSQSIPYGNSWRPAEAAVRAKGFLFAGYGTSGISLTSARHFSFFGDPELQMRTETPVQLAASHPTEVTIGETNSVTVSVTRGGSAFEGALVALVLGSSVYTNATTDAGGDASFSIVPMSLGDVTVTVSDRNSTPYEGTITVVVGSDPAIGVSPTSLTPFGYVGQNAADGAFTVSNAGPGTITYTISTNASWLSCNPTSGSSTGEAAVIAVKYDTSGLALGTYDAAITLTDAGAVNSPVTIPVSLTVGVAYLYTEDFEASASIPADMTDVLVSGSASRTWKVQVGSGIPGGLGSGHPGVSHSGTNNATLYSDLACTRRLITPVFNSAGYTNLTLNFYHTQENWQGDQDTLTVYYSTDGGTNWAALSGGQFLTSIVDWTGEALALPDGVNRIAFEGFASYGYGVCLDTISVSGEPEAVYQLTVTSGQGGGAYMEGTEVPITADDPAAGQYFVNWTTADGGSFADANAASTTYTMPANAAEVAANYAANTAPTVNCSTGATALTETSATLRGQLSDGGMAEAWICWGTTDAGTGGTGDWEHVVSIGAVIEGAPFTNNVTGLATNATYWYRCYVTNNVGTDWSDDAAAFSGSPAGGVGSDGFKVQRGEIDITSGNTTATITSGVDYEAPASLDRAFIRIVNTRLTGGGKSTASQGAAYVTVSISNPENLLSSITFERYASDANFTRVTWEIIEYTGGAGGANEMIVRDQAEVSMTAGTGAATGSAVAGVMDDNDIVVFVTGQRTDSTSSGDMDKGLHTSEWLSGTDEPRLTRADTGNNASVSYAVVEWKGANWGVQRVAHTQVAAGIETETIPSPVAALDRAFIHSQVRSTSGALDEQGLQITLSATNEVSFQLESGGSAFQDAVVWIVENAETSSDRKMNVQHLSYGDPTAANGTYWINSIPQPVADTTNTSVMGESCRSAGTGTTWPRGVINLRITDTNSVQGWYGDNGQTYNYSYCIVEWPETVGSAVANVAPSAVTDSQAQLNGALDASGTNYDVYVYYGAIDGGTNAGAWTSSAYVGSWTNVSTNVSYSVSLGAGTTYHYTFMASNTSESVWASPSWQLTMPGQGSSVATPTGLIATAVSTSQVDLAWTDNATNETGFLVERSLTSGSGFATLGTAAQNAESYSDATVTPGLTYYYRVSATNASETSAASVQASATVPKMAATVTLTGTNQVYDQAARVVSYVTVPAGLGVNLTYDGNSWAPTNAGSYAISATVNEVSYQGATNGTLVVSKATPAVTGWPTATSIEEGQTLADSTLSGGVPPVSGSFDFENDSYQPPIGTNAVNVVFTPNDTANYNTVTDTVDVVVTAALIPATVTLSDTNQTYTGSGLAVTVTTVPAGLSVSVTYNGLSTLPVNVGSYAVTGTVVEAGYTGFTNGTLVISKATPTIHTWPTTTNAIVVGQPVSDAPLDGGNASVTGTFSYDTPSATPGVGTNAMAVTFTPTDTANCKTVAGTVDVTVLPLAPDAPTNVSAVVSLGQVDLSWDAVAGATAYNVKRSTTQGSGYTTVGSPAVINYSDSVSNGQTYYYVVSAVNAGGEGANSTEVSAALPHTLPFAEDFEGLSVGDWDGQNLWAASNASVQTSLKIDTKAGSLTSELGFARQDFAGNETNVWTDMAIQPAFCPDAMTPPFTDATASVYFNTNGNPVAFDGTNRVTYSGTVVTTGSWVQVTIRSDYTAKTWDLYIDSVQVGTNLGFYSESVTKYETLDVRGGAPDVMAVDDIGVTTISPFGAPLWLTVNSLYGTPAPSGSSQYISNSLVNAWISNPSITNDLTNYVCTGWIGTGSAPASGSGTNTSFTITEDTTITWQWKTNYWIELNTTGN